MCRYAEDMAAGMEETERNFGLQNRHQAYGESHGNTPERHWECLSQNRRYRGTAIDTENNGNPYATKEQEWISNRGLKNKDRLSTYYKK